MRNNRLTTNTTDPNYDSIPFKNKDIDRIQRNSPESKSSEQYKAEQDAKREAIRLGKEKAKRELPQYKSAEQFKAENDAKREEIKKEKKLKPKF